MNKLDIIFDIIGILVYLGLAGLVISIVITLIIVVLRSLIFGV